MRWGTIVSDAGIRWVDNNPSPILRLGTFVLDANINGVVVGPFKTERLKMIVVGGGELITGVDVDPEPKVRCGPHRVFIVVNEFLSTVKCVLDVGLILDVGDLIVVAPVFYQQSVVN